MRRHKDSFERDTDLERKWMHRYTELKEIVDENEEDDEDQVSDEEEDDTEEEQGEDSDQDEKVDEEHVEEEYDEPEQTGSQKEIVLNLQPQDVSKIFLYV